VNFKYENLPFLCFHCGCIVHRDNGCKAKPKRRIHSTEGPLPWRVWLRAKDPRRKGEGLQAKMGDEWQNPTKQGGYTSDSEKHHSSPAMESTDLDGNPGESRSPINAGSEDLSNCHSEGTPLKATYSKSKEDGDELKTSTVTKTRQPLEFGKGNEVQDASLGVPPSRVNSHPAWKEKMSFNGSPNTSLRNLKQIARGFQVVAQSAVNHVL
jgi:hypothetical protein